MNILLIPDKFKGSLTTYEVIKALKRGINRVSSEYKIHESVVSDGGDGFLDAINETVNVERISVVSQDSLGRKLDSYYLIDRSHKTAYIELANTSGLMLLSSHERNPSKTSTYGTGLEIKHAISNDAKKLYIGLGGSATNEGGIGIAAALGYKFFDINNQQLHPIGENLIKIKHIGNTDFKIQKSLEIYAVNDVKNPLFGKNGAAFVYAKQKGASDKEIISLNEGLEHLSLKVKEILAKDMAHLEGAGAAGGTAYGLNVFLDAIFIDGAEFILKRSGVYRKLECGDIDLIITGEGKIDGQTAHGKLIMGVSTLAKKFGVPAIAICGQNSLNDHNIKKLGLNAIIEVADATKSLQFNMDNAAQLIEEAIFKYLTINANQP